MSPNRAGTPPNRRWITAAPVAGLGLLLAAAGCSDGPTGPEFLASNPSASQTGPGGVGGPGTTVDPSVGVDPSVPLTNPSATAPDGMTPTGPGLNPPTAGAGGVGSGVDMEGQGGAGPDPAILAATPVTNLRLLTQIEYRKSIGRLLEGVDPTVLELPDDNHVKSFTTVGGGLATVNQVAGEAYEAAAQAVAREVFNDPERWQALVGCEPQPDLSDACVETFIRSFGRKAFRRDLEEEEVSQWLKVARDGATLAEDAATGLAVVVAGMLQSPHFLYRVEHAIPDIELGRIRYDGASLATRLSYLFTGSTPEEWLLDAASRGELDTPEGIRNAAEQLLAQEDAAAFMTEFFVELTELWQVLELERPAELFPDVDELRMPMLEESRRWLSDVVLAPGADVRTFFDSDTTFVNGALAEFYGLPMQGFGQSEDFQERTLGSETGRAGILGKAGFLLAHSSPDSTNPTKRGKFIIEQFKCLEVPPVPADLMVSVPKAEEGEVVTTRELFEERHRVDATCVTCHSLMDPFGFALEHFDAIGRYRETENGLPINAASEFQGVSFDGAAELGTALRNDATTAACFVEHLYRYANGTPESEADAALIDGLVETLAERNYVWRDLVVDFAASDAFTSLAPTPIMDADAEE